MIHDIYNFVSGPLAWCSFIIFIGVSLVKFIYIVILAKKKDSFVFTYMSFKYAMRSIFHRIAPFASVNMRVHPVMTLMSFSFHICAIVIPLFLLGHIVLLKESFNISWPFLPEIAADIMTIIVIIVCIFFLARRIFLPEVKFLTTASDYIILAIVAAPFITGFWFAHQWPGFKVMGILHILLGEIMLIAIPFTKLNHMIFFLFTRGYMGSEFGGVRHAKDW